MHSELDLNNLNRFEHGGRQFFHMTQDMDGTGAYIEDVLGTMYYFALSTGNRSYIQFDHATNSFFALDELGDDFDVFFDPEQSVFFTDHDTAYADLQLEYSDERGNFLLNSNHNAIAIQSGNKNYFVQQGGRAGYYVDTDAGRINLESYFSSMRGGKVFIEPRSKQIVTTNEVNVNLQINEYAPELSIRRMQRRQSPNYSQPIMHQPVHRVAPMQEVRHPRKKHSKLGTYLFVLAAFALAFYYRNQLGIQIPNNEVTYTYSDPDTDPNFTITTLTDEEAQESGFLDNYTPAAPTITAPDYIEDPALLNTDCEMGLLIDGITSPVDPNAVNPLDGTIGFVSTNSGGHPGTDFALKGGTFNQLAFAAEAGRVIYTRNSYTGSTSYSNDGEMEGPFQNWDNYGNVIAIEHQDGLTIYAHLAQNSIQVAEGECVAPGEQIATIGKTGYAGNVEHLHFEARRPKTCTAYTNQCTINDNDAEWGLGN